MSGETILVVDDGADNRDFVVQYVLAPNGYKYMTARDGMEGLQMALQHRPDLILLDWNMPRMDGVEVLRNLRARNVDIPTILMTFHGSEELAIEVYRMGVRDYVKKPFYPEEMLAAIDNSLTEVRLRREKEALTSRVMHANRELEQRVHELNVLYRMGKSVTSIMEMDRLLPRIVDAAVQVTGAEEGYLLLLDDEHLICRALKRHNEPHAQPADARVKEPMALRAIKNGQPLVVDPSEINRQTPNMPWSAAYAPLMIQDEVIGVLGIKNVSQDSHAFTKRDSALLSALTDYAAIALQNAHNYQALIQLKEQEKEHIRGTFERFVPPSVVDHALAQPESLQLGGVRREISVLFADIRGYSTWSEDATPEQVLETLNHYHSLAAEVVLAWEGTLDKFMGDGFMAIFNAPDDQQDHVHRAADAALALIKAANEVQTQHGHRLIYSVGVNVGEAVVGYVGTERAMNYTAIGDTVNLAKRLEEYSAPGQVLISDHVLQRLGRLAQVRPLGDVRVKGRRQPTGVYELTGLAYEVG